MAMVMAAFFDSGLRNVGTPSDTASTPASATAPDDNARSSIKIPSDLEPEAQRHSPVIAEPERRLHRQHSTGD